MLSCQENSNFYLSHLSPPNPTMSKSNKRASFRDQNKRGICLEGGKEKNKEKLNRTYPCTRTSPYSLSFIPECHLIEQVYSFPKPKRRIHNAQLLSSLFGISFVSLFAGSTTTVLQGSTYLDEIVDSEKLVLGFQSRKSKYFHYKFSRIYINSRFIFSPLFGIFFLFSFQAILRGRWEAVYSLLPQVCKTMTRTIRKTKHFYIDFVRKRERGERVREQRKRNSDNVISGPQLFLTR